MKKASTYHHCDGGQEIGASAIPDRVVFRARVKVRVCVRLSRDYLIETGEL